MGSYGPTGCKPRTPAKPANDYCGGGLQSSAEQPACILSFIWLSVQTDRSTCPVPHLCHCSRAYQLFSGPNYILIHRHNVAQICVCTRTVVSKKHEYVYIRRGHNWYPWRVVLNDQLCLHCTARPFARFCRLPQAANLSTDWHCCLIVAHHSWRGRLQPPDRRCCLKHGGQMPSATA